MVIHVAYSYGLIMIIFGRKHAQSQSEICYVLIMMPCDALSTLSKSFGYCAEKAVILFLLVYDE